MPNAGDAYLNGGQLPAPNNPLNRIQLGSFSSLIDPIKVLEQWVQWFETYGFQAIEQITGIDLSAFLPSMNAVVDALTTLFGDLNPTSGTFNPLDAVTTFINLMVEVGASLPVSLFQEIFSLFGGASNSTQAGNFFTSITSLLGNPAGMTSGSPTIPGLSSIKILKPLFSLFGGATTSTQAGNFFTNLLSFLGTPTLTGSTGSFDPTAAATTFINDILNPTGLLASVNSIVEAITGSAGNLTDLSGFFTDLLGIFGGAGTLGQANNVFTNLLALFNNPTLTGAPGSFNNAPIWSDIINNVITPLNLLPTADLLFSMIMGAGRDSSGDPLADLQNAFQHMPFGNILGVGGPANIGTSVQSGWDQFISGFVGIIGSGASLADAFNVSQQVSSNSARGAMAFDIAGIRNDTSLNSGFLPTTQSNIAFDKVALQATAPTFALTQSTAITSYQRIGKASNFGVVSWHGSGVTSITDAYVNIFKMNTTTGLNTLVHSSANIIGSLSGTMQQNVYSLPTPIAVQAGDVYGIELAIRGAGTHNVVGASTWIPDQTVFPRRFSSVRNSGTSAPPSTFTPSYGTNVPFIEFGVSASDVALPRAATSVQFATPGTTSYPIPDWANFVDRIVLGGPGGGHQGGTWGIGGSGGEAAVWVSDTLARGTDFTGTASLTTTVGAGGSAGVGGNGGNGATSSSAISGTHTLTSTGGLGATSFDVVGSAHAGQSPGNYTFPGGGDPWVIAGGVAQNTYGATGNPLGGAGAGGNWVSFQPGGAGAPGVILYRFRQS